MQFHDFGSNAQVSFGTIIAATAATAATNIVDCLQFRRAALILQQSISGTGSTSANKLQESTGGTSGSTWTDVTGGAFTNVSATSTGVAATAAQVMNIDLSKRLRYLRMLYTGTGSTNTGFVSATFLLMQPETAAIGISQSSTPITV